MTGYLETLKLYYEEEIEGEAYFARLSERFDNPDHTHKLRLLAEVERHAAEAVAPLIARHALTPRPSDELIESGKADAEATALDWPALIAGMQESYKGYLAAFEALEDMGPEEDRARLSFLTEHEVAAIKFLDQEVVDPGISAAPLEVYLATPAETWRSGTE
ncbi:MAG: hypothetical protein AB3N13_08445 [Arenibacterium sp.]